MNSRKAIRFWSKSLGLKAIGSSCRARPSSKSSARRWLLNGVNPVKLFLLQRKAATDRAKLDSQLLAPKARKQSRLKGAATSQKKRTNRTSIVKTPTMKRFTQADIMIVRAGIAVIVDRAAVVEAAVAGTDAADVVAGLAVVAV